MPKSSFKASDLKVGGGLYEGPVKITGARFDKSDFNGKAERTTCLIIDGEHLDPTGEIKTTPFLFGLGRGWEPSDDSETPADGAANFYCHETATAPNAGSAFGLLVASFEKAGYEIDSDKGAEDLEGRMFNFKRQAAPIEQNKNRVVYVVDAQLDEVPWEKSAKKKAVVSPKADNSTEAAADSTVDSDTLVEIAVAIVKGAGNRGLRISELPQAIAKTIATWPDVTQKKALLAQRADIVKALNPEYFENNSDVINYNSKTGQLTIA